MFDNSNVSPIHMLVTRWKQEHSQILKIALEIIKLYELKEFDFLKMKLSQLNDLIVSHLMFEDSEFYKFFMFEESLEKNILEEIEDFIDTFKDIRSVIMDFLIKYTSDDALYDKEFIDTFKKIVDALKERIDYEEHNLYEKLEKSQG